MRANSVPLARPAHSACAVSEKVGSSSGLSSQRAPPSQINARTTRITSLRSHPCSYSRSASDSGFSTTPMRSNATGVR